MPTTVNRLYSSGRFSGKSKRWKSDEYNSFLTQAQYWEMHRQSLVAKSADLCKSMVLEGYLIRVDTYFVFRQTDLWTKPKTKKDKPKPKQLDASNRIKAMHDVLAKMLGIDDKYFWGGNFEKVQGNQQYVTIIIKFCKPKHIEEIQHESTAKTSADTPT